VWAIVLLHYAVTLAPPLSAFLVLRWRWFVPIQLGILAWALSIPFLQWPCPLTDLEKRLRAEAGMPVYESHFVAHYIYAPLGAWSWTWELFNVVAPVTAYTLLLRRRRTGLTAPASHPSC
jgi:hypothetical protein